MRFLHTADLHLGKTLEGRSRLPEQQALLDEIATLAETQQVDLVLLAGDLYDSFNPPAEAERLLYAFLHRISANGRRAVVLIAGNHDQPQRLSAAAPLAQEQGIYIVGLPGQLPTPDAPTTPPERVCLMRAENHLLELRLPQVPQPVQVLALPYCSEARLQELYIRDLADEAGARADYQERLAALLAEAGQGFRADSINIVLAHLFLAGGSSTESERPLAMGVAQVGGSYGVSPRIFPPLSQYVALGHLHRPQQSGAALPCVYAGSPLAYSFSEAGQAKSVVVGEISPGAAASFQRLPLQSGYGLAVWRAQDYAEALAWCQDERKHLCWTNLEISLTEPLSADQLAALREAHPRLLAVRSLLPELEQEQAPAPDLSIGERFCLFVAQQTGAQATDELLALFLELLADQSSPQAEEEALA